MKTIGLIGGLTWHSTLEYYKVLNQMANERLGGDESAKIIIYSVNFGEIKYLTQKGQWDNIALILSKAAQSLENAGAQCIMIGANTMHHVADLVTRSVNIPLIHVAHAVATEIKALHLTKVGLLGTRYTMELPFYKGILTSKNILVIAPPDHTMEELDEAIYNELARGNFKPETKVLFKNVIAQLVSQGAEGIIPGCAEIPLLLRNEEFSVPVFDTLHIHCKAAIEFALT